MWGKRQWGIYEGISRAASLGETPKSFQPRKLRNLTPGSGGRSSLASVFLTLYSFGERSFWWNDDKHLWESLQGQPVGCLATKSNMFIPFLRTGWLFVCVFGGCAQGGNSLLFEVYCPVKPCNIKISFKSVLAVPIFYSKNVVHVPMNNLLPATWFITMIWMVLKRTFILFLKYKISFLDCIYLGWPSSSVT